MSEVAKVREALEALWATVVPEDAVVDAHNLRRGLMLQRAFVAHGLKVCEEYEAAEGVSGPEEEARVTARLDLVSAILWDAGLLEEGR